MCVCVWTAGGGGVGMCGGGGGGACIYTFMHYTRMHAHTQSFHSSSHNTRYKQSCRNIFF